jgi:hypothetical protein
LIAFGLDTPYRFLHNKPSKFIVQIQIYYIDIQKDSSLSQNNHIPERFSKASGINHSFQNRKS